MGSVCVFNNSSSINGQHQININNVNLNKACLLTQEKAVEIFEHIKASLSRIAAMNRLQASVSDVQPRARNTLTAESAIRDADMAKELANLTKNQILAQANISALAHSAANSQTLIDLLR